MERASTRGLSEAELADLYHFVESGYRARPRIGLVRGLAGRFGRAIGLRRNRAEPAKAPSVRSYDSPIDAVFMPAPGVFTVPVDWFRNHALFGHGSGAFNAWEATARQLVHEPELDHRDTILAEFFQRFRPASLAELSFADPEEDVPRSSRLWDLSPREYLGVYPWSSALRRWPSHVPAHLRLTEYGPVGDEILQLEVWRLRRLVKSIGRDGYRPLESSGTRGHFIKADSGARFLVKSGFHRGSTLAALGYADLPVVFSSFAPSLLTLDSLPHWPMVKNGLFEPALAEKLTRRLVTDNGADLARRLGFEPHP